MATHSPGDPPQGPVTARPSADRTSEAPLAALAGHKAALRKRFAAARDALPAATVRLDTARLTEHLARFIAERGARTVALYAAFRSELRLGALDVRLRGAGLSVVYPRCAGDTLAFAPADPALPSDWQRGPFGLDEPVAAPIAVEPLELVVVPALAVDRLGQRLGYGGGFYDRFLAAHPALRARTVAAVFEAQLVPDGLLVCEPHDMRVAFVATPAGLWPAAPTFEPSSATQTHPPGGR